MMAHMSVSAGLTVVVGHTQDILMMYSMQYVTSATRLSPHGSKGNCDALGLRA